MQPCSGEEEAQSPLLMGRDEGSPATPAQKRGSQRSQISSLLYTSSPLLKSQSQKKKSLMLKEVPGSSSPKLRAAEDARQLKIDLSQIPQIDESEDQISSEYKSPEKQEKKLLDFVLNKLSTEESYSMSVFTSALKYSDSEILATTMDGQIQVFEVGEQHDLRPVVQHVFRAYDQQATFIKKFPMTQGYLFTGGLNRANSSAGHTVVKLWYYNSPKSWNELGEFQDLHSEPFTALEIIFEDYVWIKKEQVISSDIDNLDDLLQMQGDAYPYASGSCAQPELCPKTVQKKQFVNQVVFCTMSKNDNLKIWKLQFLAKGLANSVSSLDKLMEI